MTTDTQIPSWLESTPEQPATTAPTITLYPTTNAAKELLDLQRNALFVNIIERMEQGSLWKEIMEDSPYDDKVKNNMMAWIKRQPDKWKEYKEAQAIGAEIIAATTISIADGDGLEDVARSNLRVQQRWRYCEMVDKKRFGKDQPAQSSFGSGGITVNIGEVKSPYVKPTEMVQEVQEVQVIENAPTGEFGADL